MSTYTHSVVMSSAVSLVSDLRVPSQNRVAYTDVDAKIQGPVLIYCMAHKSTTTRIQAKQTINSIYVIN